MAALLGGACVAAPLATTLHLAPHGSDDADGTSRVHAVASMARAWELAGKQEPGDSTVTVLVHPGTYRGQSLLIEGSRPVPAVTWRGLRRDGKRPVFVGDHRHPTWLRVKASDGKPTGLTVEGLEIRDYLTAISLEGNRDDPAAFNEGTVIRNNVFQRIGTIAINDATKTSTAAVRFVNSRDNTVAGNRFLTIRNVKHCGGLHALYLAHFSSSNRIVDNHFEDLCGSVVRFRDRANDNVVRDNRFSRVDRSPAVEEWFCDMGGRKGCTKALGECPSTGNIETNNTLADSVGAELVSIKGASQPRAWCDAEDFRRQRVISR
ncbi:right-handed parallel beta-helix repeat-containing protein [Methylibium sp.]|uniref:right-handed parallel beta-helix repeat-containing protein n=1 Tax=Methylibium sp. TaxID=2067992 RepID=UPI0017CEA930|nr:right-handed parallel beta-helix repeat-containing protein [Methylibium sp.]MBA3588104.1 right-handed parallel beta-helix repeat-containing protein [Methylibium sp.]